MSMQTSTAMQELPGEQKVAKAAADCLAEAWEKFENAIHLTGAGKPASITISVKFKPATEAEGSSITVEGKLALPTVSTKMAARDAGGQLVLGFPHEE